MTIRDHDFPPVQPHQYAKEWKRYTNSFVLLIGLFVGYLPFGVIADYLIDRLLGGNNTVMMIAAFTWMAAYGVAGLRFGSFRCPRCHEQFFCRKRFTFFGFYNPFARHCWNCGLEKWAGE